MSSLQGTPLIAGAISGVTMVLKAPLGLWEGLSPTGQITRPGHPSDGRFVKDKILIFAYGMTGVPSGGNILECLRTRVGPAAMLMPTKVTEVALASFLGGELYGYTIPILQLSEAMLKVIPDNVLMKVNEEGLLSW